MPSDSKLSGIVNLIQQAAKKAKFFVDGTMPKIDPVLKINNVGVLQFPLNAKDEKKLLSVCSVAPFGKGTETLIDTKVRNVRELDPSQFSLSEEWQNQIAEITQRVAIDLGLPRDQLKPEIYKLLAYKKGGFFLDHRDSEKSDGMVASLIVVLPNYFRGGKLTVRHGELVRNFSVSWLTRPTHPYYAAFYADCEHSVEKVTQGLRVCLAYNLVLMTKELTKKNPPRSTSSPLANAIRDFVTARPNKPLVVALEHFYTQPGLKMDLLKGKDRQIAAQVMAAAEDAECLVHLAQVQRYILQDAYDGSEPWASRSSRYSRRSGITLGEIYDDEWSATEWRDADGSLQSWEQLPIDSSAVISTIPIDTWKPTEEEYEGYTGNAGNSFERWYHRSALIVWHRSQHYNILCTGDRIDILPLFYEKAKDLERTPKTRYSEERQECIQFAQALIRTWPEADDRSYYYKEKHSIDGLFPNFVVQLKDQPTAALFLKTVCDRDYIVDLSSYVVETCREFGSTAFEEEMTSIMRLESFYSQCYGIPCRDVEWLSEYCNKCTDTSEATSLGKELCKIAVERFCSFQTSKDFERSSWHEKKNPLSNMEKGLPFLVKALLALDVKAELKRVTEFVEASPTIFRINECQVPSLVELHQWIKERKRKTPKPISDWLKNVRNGLKKRTKKPPTPPKNWSRAATMDCPCQYCKKANEFLENPVEEVGRIPARESARSHLMQELRSNQCDVSTSLEKKGSPYSLILKKNQASFERTLELYNLECKLLDSLPS